MAVGIAVMCVYTSSYDQGTCAFYIMLFFLVLHSIYRPFQSQLEDYLELVSLVCVLILTMVGIVSKPDPVLGVTSLMGAALQGFAFFVILLQFTFCFVVVTLLVRKQVREIPRAGTHVLNDDRAQPAGKKGSLPSKEVNPFDKAPTDLEKDKDEKEEREEYLKELKRKILELTAKRDALNMKLFKQDDHKSVEKVSLPLPSRRKEADSGTARKMQHPAKSIRPSSDLHPVVSYDRESLSSEGEAVSDDSPFMRGSDSTLKPSGTPRPRADKGGPEVDKPNMAQLWKQDWKKKIEKEKEMYTRK